MCRQINRLLTMDFHRARPPPNQPHDRPQGTRTPSAIAAKQRNDLAFIHVKIHPMQNMRFTVPTLQIGDFQKSGLAHGS